MLVELLTPLDQLKVYGVTPPEAEAVIEPSLLPLHDGLV